MPSSPLADRSTPPARLAHPVRLVAIDMDGTLLPDFSTVVSKRNQLALKAAQQTGIVVAIATGRRQAFTAPLLANVGLRADTPLLTSNGAVTRTFSGDRIDFTHLQPSLAREFARVLKGVGMLVFTLDKSSGPDLIVEDMAIARGRLARWVEANRHAMVAIKPIESALADDTDIIQGMAAGTIREMTEAERLLSLSPLAADFDVVRTAYPGHDLSILDLLPRGVSKSSALERLAARLNIPQAQTMAIGDNWNDVSMLDWAGTGVLMGNASPDLRALAPQHRWLVGPTNQDDGVAVMLELAIQSLAIQSLANPTHTSAKV
jgi:Cof subfamily protein (haloacid dehalogenase superfamily)